MARDSIPYDPTWKSLNHPESRPAISDFADGWSLEQICAELSRLAYFRFDDGPEQEAELADALVKAGLAKPRCVSSADTGAQAFVTAMPGGALIVVFRGTQSDKFKDIEADAQFRLQEWAGPGRVHHGFMKAYQSLQREVRSALGMFPNYAEDKLVVTGHSLGAAMATLMASEFQKSTLVTFGSPRVGDKGFVEQFEGRDVRRYVDCTDFVSRVPPPIGYGHVCKMRYIDRFGQIHYPPPDDASVDRDRRAAGLAYLAKYAWQVWKNVPVRSGADHAPINYVSALLGRRNGS
jgi:hypothetical protein